jgi:cell division protein FtsB
MERPYKSQKSKVRNRYRFRVNFFHFVSPISIRLELGTIILLMVYYLLQRQITKRRQANETIGDSSSDRH